MTGSNLLYGPIDLAPTIDAFGNMFSIFLSPEMLKLFGYGMLFLIVLLVIRKCLDELIYRGNYGHSSGFFERLFSFGKPVFNIRDSFFTDAEEAFYRNLKEVLYKLFQYRYEVYPKTRLNDVFETKYSEDWFMKSHVDFLIVDRHQDFRPVLAVEVDGDSHNTRRRQKKSDKFKDGVFQEAGLPLVRIKNEQADNIKVAYAIVYEYLK